MERPESQWIERARRGDPAAWEALYAAGARRIKAYLLRSGFAPADADDLLQETFSRAFRSLGSFDADRGSFAGWLAAIARNVARSHWSRRPAPESFDPQLAEETLAGGDNPGESAAENETVEAVRACVDALPAELARIVRLRYVQARTTRGVAEATGLPEATVRLRLTEARGLLAACLRKKGLTE